MDFMNLNQAAHGDREYAHAVARVGVPHKIVVGEPSSADVKKHLAAWLWAAIGWNKSQNLKLARFGDNMRFVSVTDGDKVSAQLQFGMSVENYGVNFLVNAVSKVNDADAEKLCDEYEKLYDVSAELKRGGARHDSLVYAAKQEIALHKILTDGGFDAFTSNFEDLGDLKQLPGLAVQRLMAMGYGFGGEGDWKTSALGAILKSMTPAGGGTSFMEDYTYHFGPGTPKILGAHMLEVCPTITKSKPKIEIHPLGIGGKEDPVRMVFTATPAEARVVCLVDMGDRFRIISNEITVVEPNEALPNLPVAHAVWEPKPTLEISAESWMLAGGSHHTVLTNAVSLEAIEDFARMAKVEHVIIDGETRIREFRRELQWSAAYHRFAERI
jgi:L-arabinose isomerase